MSVSDVDTTVAAHEAKDAPEDQPLSNVPECHNKYYNVQPQPLSGQHLHDTDDLRLHHLLQKAGAVAEHLHMNYDGGMAHMLTIIGIIVVIYVTLYHLCGAIIYTLQVEDMVY